MSTSDILSELEAIGAVGHAHVEFEDPEVVESEPEEVEAPPAPQVHRVDPQRIAEIVGFCDKLLQVFGILARANTDLIRTVEEMKVMVQELEFPHGELEEGGADDDLEEDSVGSSVEAQIPTPVSRNTIIGVAPPSNPPEDEDDIPVDISAFGITPSVPLPPELLADPPSFPPPIAKPVILPPPNDHDLVEAAMREMGLRS